LLVMLCCCASACKPRGYRLWRKETEAEHKMIERNTEGLALALGSQGMKEREAGACPRGKKKGLWVGPRPKACPVQRSKAEAEREPATPRGGERALLCCLAGRGDIPPPLLLSSL